MSYLLKVGGCTSKTPLGRYATEHFPTFYVLSFSELNKSRYEHFVWKSRYEHFVWKSLYELFVWKSLYEHFVWKSLYDGSVTGA